MITEKGKDLIAQYLAGKIERWAGAIEVGIGETAATVNDTSLEFPHLRFDIDNFDYDDVSNEVIVRATIPQDLSTTIYEVGIFSSGDFPIPTEGNQILLDYTTNSAVYTESNVSFSTANARLGSEGKLISGATGFVRGYINGRDLSVYKGVDNFNLAYFYTNTGGTPTVTIRMETTPSDYYEHTFTPTVGYNIETFQKDSMTSTGSPTWATIDSVYISTNASADLLLDGIMIEESLVVENYGMVARRVLTTPRQKPEGVEAEMTFKIGLTF